MMFKLGKLRNHSTYFVHQYEIYSVGLWCVGICKTLKILAQAHLHR